ncbi:MAG: rod-binding protein [Candidatus Omnitrophica bacterium]|nr:rod-binding protein [Candidatus Omnitrophota bacterium]
MVNAINTVKPVDMLIKQEMPYEVSMDDRREKQQIEFVAQEFEALFIEQILKQADQAMDHEDNILYAGHGEDIVRGMYNQQLARSMTAQGGFGIADMIRAELVERSTGIKEE